MTRDTYQDDDVSEYVGYSADPDNITVGKKLDGDTITKTIEMPINWLMKLKH